MVRDSGDSSADGGVAARRAVIRWAWRLFRREWRQQLLIVALLSVAVAAAVAVTSAAYNVVPGGEDAEFGSTEFLMRADGSDPEALGATIDAAEEWFGEVDLIRRTQLTVPGVFDPVERRAQDPEGPYGGPMLALTAGRYPSADDEAAVTDGAARELGLGVGDTWRAQGGQRRIVGTVENPSDLDDEFVLVPPDADGQPDSVTILVGGDRGRFDEFSPPGGAVTEFGVRARNEGITAAAGVLGIAEVILLLVSLVAAAGFVVIGQRRLRALGMLAAMGATEKHLRLVMVANGAVVGAIAALIGTAAGLVGWFAAIPSLESAASQRIDRFDVPWWLIGITLVLAVVTAAGAAWWPARVVARVPITAALSGRPPRPQPVHRSALLAGLLIAAGLTALASAGDIADSVAVDWTNVLLVGFGTVATVIGVLLLSPIALRLLGVAARRLPVAMRLALRDLARHQGRSGVALAAIGLALGIPVAVVVTATAAQDAAAEGNLSDHQLVVRSGDRNAPFVPDWSTGELDDAEGQVDRVAEALGDPSVTPLEVAIDPDVEPTGDGQQVITLAERRGGGLIDVALVYVASPELLRHYGLDSVGGSAELLTSESGRLSYLGARNRDTGRFGPQPTSHVHRMEPTYSSLPQAIITPEALRRRGWVAAPAAWLVESGTRPFTSEQLSAAHDLAAAAGLTVESRRDQGGLSQLRSGATAAGMLLALGVLAMTVGLIRSEAGRDLRTLTATGATSTVRRTLTATTAGGLTFLGALLGTAGAYLGLTFGFLSDIGSLSPVPLGHLLVIVLGAPLIAVVAGWLLAGRDPPALARQPIE